MSKDYNFPSNCIVCFNPKAFYSYKWVTGKTKERDHIVTHFYNLPMCKRCYYFLVFPFKFLMNVLFIGYFIASVYIWFFSNMETFLWWEINETPVLLKIFIISWGFIVPCIPFAFLKTISWIIEKLFLVKFKKYPYTYIPIFDNKEYKEYPFTHIPKFKNKKYNRTFLAVNDIKIPLKV